MPDAYHSKKNLMKAMKKGAPISLIKEERRESKMSPSEMSSHEKKETKSHHKLERKYGLK